MQPGLELAPTGRRSGCVIPSQAARDPARRRWYCPHPTGPRERGRVPASIENRRTTTPRAELFLLALSGVVNAESSCQDALRSQYSRAAPARRGASKKLPAFLPPSASTTPLASAVLFTSHIALLLQKRTWSVWPATGNAVWRRQPGAQPLIEQTRVTPSPPGNLRVERWRSSAGDSMRLLK